MSLFISYCFFVLFQAHCRFVVVPLLFASPKFPKLWHIYFKHKFYLNTSIFQQLNNFSIAHIGNNIFRILPKIFFDVATCRNILCPLPSSYTGFAISPYLIFIRIWASRESTVRCNDVKSLIYDQVKHLWLALFA